MTGVTACFMQETLVMFRTNVARTAEFALAAVVTLVVFGYLLYAMLVPEKF